MLTIAPFNERLAKPHNSHSHIIEVWTFGRQLQDTNTGCEELGIDCTVRQLAFVGEHLFEVHGMPNHRIEFHYLVDVDSEAVPITTRDEGHHYPCVWLPLQSLADYPLKPEFLTHELPRWDGELTHIATVE